ncbi:ABC transporter, ATP-binding protein [Photobacterium marinum]|uniref:ABC transporter, ATP-binding protein n=1 Tax=Photobacterium marinum TaxID=1056511 RepID=L8JD74_9GAMM|nr:ABC transporter ATP-binding protein/permease [Photobacterium marinum]ELR66228.1 ABC transporter, ATP-binding protein [Photobacterium marinum]
MQLNNLISLTNRHFLLQVWNLASPYWKSQEKWLARILLVTIIALNFGTVQLAVLYSDWNRDFFNLMQNKEWHNFWPLLGNFVWIMGIFTLVDLGEDYLRRTLRIRWRRWLTDAYLTQWLQNNRLFRHQAQKGAIDNPDQRVTNDIKEFCDSTLRMGLGLLRTVTSLFSFVVILWNLSGQLEFEFAGSEWVIPGYMVWVAILYSIVGTWLTHKVAKPLTKLNFEQERHEANFRFHLMRVREHAESITLQSGEEAERKRAGGLFERVWENWQQLTMMKLRYNAFNSGYNEVARIFPYLVAAPRLMSGALQLGDMMQTATGFYRVQEAFSWFVDSYESVAEWKAVTDRLINFHVQLEQLSGPASAIEQGEAPGWSNLTVINPQDEVLFDAGTGALEVNTMISGPSGCGKSTLFRTLAGLWPCEKGQIVMPQGSDCMFIPQRGYLPHASMREVLSYPYESGKWTDEIYMDALTAVGLNELADLDTSDTWQHRLSGGELQRVMIARALVHQPEWLFLDEALSAVDEQSEQAIYVLLKEKMSKTRVISISHRSNSVNWHEHHLMVCKQTNQLVKEVVC